MNTRSRAPDTAETYGLSSTLHLRPADRAENTEFVNGKSDAKQLDYEGTMRRCNDLHVSDKAMGKKRKSSSLATAPSKKLKTIGEKAAVEPKTFRYVGRTYKPSVLILRAYLLFQAFS